MNCNERFLVKHVATAFFAFLLTAIASAQIPINSNNPTVATPTFSIDEPGRVAYVATAGPVIGGNPMLFYFPTVPSGHRLVIQNVSAHVLAQGSGKQVVLLVNSSRGTSTQLFPVINQSDIYTGGPTTFYADAGDQFQISVFDPDNGLNFIAGLATVTGYEVDCKVAQCAPIAGMSPNESDKPRFPVSLKH